MSLNDEYLALARSTMAAIEVPAITGLYLPDIEESDEYRDEFGFVYLADGTAAPFYVSLPGLLPQLWARFPEPAAARPYLIDCLDGWQTAEQDRRALALGAFNAVSQHLMRRAAFRFPPRGTAAGPEQVAGDRVGMVGYFCPVIDQLRDRGIEVLVLEQQPDRVPEREGVSLTQDAAELAKCRRVICTASALINDSMAEILDHCRDAERLEVIGPSGSGLPDVLFAHGVDALGGVVFEDAAALQAALARQESWGSVGRKYELTPAGYPGVEALLSGARNRI